jgi:hypothetical protein
VSADASAQPRQQENPPFYALGKYVPKTRKIRVRMKMAMIAQRTNFKTANSFDPVLPRL